MKPAEKSPFMNTLLDDLTKSLFGQSRTGSIESNTCVDCQKPATDFRDDVFRKEFSISGLCQSCQDTIFGGETSR